MDKGKSLGAGGARDEARMKCFLYIWFRARGRDKRGENAKAELGSNSRCAR